MNPLTAALQPVINNVGRSASIAGNVQWESKQATVVKSEEDLSTQLQLETEELDRLMSSASSVMFPIVS